MPDRILFIIWEVWSGPWLAGEQLKWLHVIDEVQGPQPQCAT